MRRECLPASGAGAGPFAASSYRRTSVHPIRTCPPSWNPSYDFSAVTPPFRDLPAIPARLITCLITWAFTKCEAPPCHCRQRLPKILKKDVYFLWLEHNRVSLYLYACCHCFSYRRAVFPRGVIQLPRPPSPFHRSTAPFSPAALSNTRLLSVTLAIAPQPGRLREAPSPRLGSSRLPA